MRLSHVKAIMTCGWHLHGILVLSRVRSHAPQLCLVMDEVDGMSAGDRGGVQDLIMTIKAAKLPIICICNDKYHQKLRSLRNHCLEFEFRCAQHCCVRALWYTEDATCSKYVIRILLMCTSICA